MEWPRYENYPCVKKDFQSDCDSTLFHKVNKIITIDRNVLKNWCDDRSRHIICNPIGVQSTGTLQNLLANYEKAEREHI